MRKTLTTAALLLAWPMLLIGCVSVPTACPNPPEPPARAPLGRNFQAEMQEFLSGSLPGQKPSASSSTPARTESTAK